MKHTTLTLLAAGLMMGTAYADDELAVATHKDGGIKQVRVNCDTKPEALKRLVEKKNWEADQLRLVISGVCQGPIAITRSGIEIISDSSRAGSIVVAEGSTARAGVEVVSANSKLAALKIQVPDGLAAVVARGNATVTIDGVTTTAKTDWSVPRGQFVVTDSSQAYLSNLSDVTTLVIGASNADFGAGNSGIGLTVRDTSSVRSSAGSQFAAVELSANAYLLADHQTHVEDLGVWGKASAEITRGSSVARLGMGGQTQFAAYEGSKVTGPYGIYGNVVFEVNKSSLKDWNHVANPHILYVGFNANVNGQLYPDWSWAGQGSTAQ
ncbi:hypothetical protein ACTSKR_07280 [Chitinibacteraceae bacterium HSL-7]